MSPAEPAVLATPGRCAHSTGCTAIAQGRTCEVEQERAVLLAALRFVVANVEAEASRPVVGKRMRNLLARLRGWAEPAIASAEERGVA